MNLVLLEIDSPEWEFMWQWLENHPLNQGLEQPSIALNEGESWQYMGSLKQGERVLHQFRHRNHPLTNKIESVSVQSSLNLTPDQINKQFKL